MTTVSTTKICNKCGFPKSTTEFRKQRNSCKTCNSKEATLRGRKNKVQRSEKRRLQYKKDSSPQRNIQLKHYYGITLDQYKQMLDQQNGLCKICQQPEKSVSKNGRIKRLSVDHSHDTKKVRGLLCEKCNRGIGYLNDSATLLSKAIEYLNQFND